MQFLFFFSVGKDAKHCVATGITMLFTKWKSFARVSMHLSCSVRSCIIRNKQLLISSIIGCSGTRKTFSKWITFNRKGKKKMWFVLFIVRSKWTSQTILIILFNISRQFAYFYILLIWYNVFGAKTMEPFNRRTDLWTCLYFYSFRLASLKCKFTDIMNLTSFLSSEELETSLSTESYLDEILTKEKISRDSIKEEKASVALHIEYFEWPRQDDCVSKWLRIHFYMWYLLLYFDVNEVALSFVWETLIKCSLFIDPWFMFTACCALDEILLFEDVMFVLFDGTSMMRAFRILFIYELGHTLTCIKLPTCVEET